MDGYSLSTSRSFSSQLTFARVYLFVMRFTFILIVAILSRPVQADVVLLKDGTRVEGDVKRGEGGYDVAAADGKSTHVNSSDIQSIQLGKSTGGGSAQDKLGSLKRSVDALDDLPAIIGRYNNFIQQNKNTPAAATAEKELAVWQQRFDQHMVKVGGKWVTPEQQEQLVAQSGEVIRQAYDLIKANQLKQADPIVKRALEIDPTNPVSNYLQGLLLFRAEKIVPARKAFEVVHAQLPADGATLNNLGVIAWRQNQFINSLGFYADAMLATPANKEILSNVAEALAALKDDFRKHPTAQRASRLFVEQEARLETVMAQYGWYRWGSTWLDQTRLDELKKSEKEVKEKLDTLQKQFDDLQKKFRDNADAITRDQRIMDDIASSMTYVDPRTGIAYRTQTYPESYREANLEMQTLQTENKSINENLGHMREAAKALEASKPKPKYTGVQNLIGVEGAPRIGVLAEEKTPGVTSPATTRSATTKSS